MRRAKTRIIVVTDGDRVAQRVVEKIGSELGLRCISASGGNPTPIDGREIVALLKQVPYDPVLVMFDDRGRRDRGRGEQALEYVANHPDIEVLGAVAVASNTSGCQGVAADATVDATGRLSTHGVDKYGAPRGAATDGAPRVVGDTVDVLNDVPVPVIIGIGDVGKMDEADDVAAGAPVTKKAIEEILKRSGIAYGGKTPH